MPNYNLHNLANLMKLAIPGKGWDNGIWQVYVPYYPEMLLTVQYLLSPDVPRFVSFQRPSECQDQLSKVLKATDGKTKYLLAQDLMKMMTDKYCIGTWLWIQTSAEGKAINST